MTENVENLILEHLKRFQSGQDRIENELREIKARLANLESGQASIIQHLGNLSAADEGAMLDRPYLSRAQRLLKLVGTPLF